MIVAPSEISFLGEVPVKTRTALVSAITNQIPLSFGQSTRFHGWVAGEMSWLKINNSSSGFPDDPGVPVAVTTGFDYKISRNWLAGVVFSTGHTKQTFSLGGAFDQDEFAASFYTAYQGNSLWMNSIATWGTLHYDINRQVPLGITVQRNLATTTGINLSLATEAGYNFAMPLTFLHENLSAKAATSPCYLNHGPVVGITLQKIDIDGFTETNPIGAPTALSFGSQQRNSAVTELGYQVNLDLGVWQPFAKAVWNHELADTDRIVTASLTTIVAPSYSMPAVLAGRDWGTGIVGTRARLNSNVSAYTAFFAQIEQTNVANYGGSLGLNIAFD